ncbi:hypothetical protein FPV67DRAFT_1459805 [Lyophyllum atratum]|nr:hypothetical protein FPV67DRAFT_1459805 [Lyophyllum atratum]
MIGYWSSDKTVRAGDADVTFVSSDNILFYIHRKNLETHAAAFPPAEFDTRGEIVPLTEDSRTLELLFQYIYPQRHPDLESTPFETLAPLAEAAEKYEVFAAMNICKIRMKIQTGYSRSVLPECAVEVFNYASKHEYPDILGAAAPFLLDVPLDEIVTTLSLNLVVPWLSVLSGPLLATLESGSFEIDDLNAFRMYDAQLSNGWDGAIRQLFASLGQKRSRVALDAAYAGMNIPCGHLNQATLRARLDEELKMVPGFDAFL